MKYIILLAFLLINPVTQAEEVEWKSFFDGTKTVHIKFTDIINGEYSVNVVWTPDDGYGPRLVGPASISFLKGKGYLFSVTVEDFHLPLDELKKSGILKTDDEGQALEIDLHKVYSMEYNTKSFNKISLLNNTHDYDESGSREQTPFFFEDIDFDGKDELVIVDFNSGQRGVNEYSIYKPTYKYGNMYNLVSVEPFNIVDQLSTFDKVNKTIDIYSSGGSCSNSNQKFKLVNGKYTLVELTDWDERPTMEYGYVCTESVYDFIKGQKILKSTSGSYKDFETGGRIKLGIKYY
jgi:hypothetical protein